MQKLSPTDLQSPDLVASNLTRLKELFPELITEGPSGASVNLDVLKQLVGDKTVTDSEEKYGLNWFGKRQARQIALSPSNGTLRPCLEDSVDWPTTQNLMIEGDNLEVLKLLQKSYSGKVKLIYIDPPYNTGNDFVYKDDFRDNIKNYQEKISQAPSSNPETSGRFHTEWLNMMYPRLKLAKNLLSKDGIILIQIADQEIHNTRRLGDEIFGEENFINLITVKTKVAAGASGGGEDKRLKKNIEYIVAYAASFEHLKGFANNYIETPLMDVIKEMKDAGESWKYTSVVTSFGVREKIKTIQDGDGNPIDIFLCKNIERSSIRSICKNESLDERSVYIKYIDSIFSDTNAQTSIRQRVIDATGPLEDGQMYAVEYTPTSGREKNQKVCHYYISNTVRRVIWLKDVAYEKNGEIIKKERTGTLWDDIDYNNIGKEGDVAFPNGKKPLELLKRVIGLNDQNDSLVLDFFAGSGTTAHAVFASNALDNGCRRFIAVQLPELIDATDENQNYAIELCDQLRKPRNIAELTKERLRRAGAKIKTELAEKAKAKEGDLFAESAKAAPDLGFRVFKLDSSNLKAWDGVAGLADLESSVEHIKGDRNEADILYEILLKLGLDLCVPMEKRQIAGKEVWAIGGGVLLACLAPQIRRDEVEALGDGIAAWRAELAPAGDSTVIFRDSAFLGSKLIGSSYADDVAKTNLTAILEQRGIAQVRSL